MPEYRCDRLRSGRPGCRRCRARLDSAQEELGAGSPAPQRATAAQSVRHPARPGSGTSRGLLHKRRRRRNPRPGSGAWRLGPPAADGPLRRLERRAGWRRRASQLLTDTRSRFLTRRPFIAPRHISSERPRKSRISRGVAGMGLDLAAVGTPRAGAAGVDMDPRPAAAAVAGGMAGRVTAAGTTADAPFARERSPRFRGSEGRPFRTEDDHVQPK